MSAVAAAERVLRDAGEPLHYGVIAARMLEEGVWETEAARPDAVVGRQISGSIRRHGAASPFIRVAPGVYGINQHIVPLPISVAAIDASYTVAYLDATETVLAKHAGRSPMHYVDIATRALELGLLDAKGKTHEATLYARIVADVNRADAAGCRSRFSKLGNGMVGLSRWQRGSEDESDESREMGEALLSSLSKMEPAEFELVIGQVLAEIGLDEIDVTAYHGDQGFNAVGTLNAAGAFPIRAAVQVKRWKRTVGSTEVRAAREASSVDEHPMIVTTSGFTKGAFAEAYAPGERPVGLVAGSRLVELMMEHSIGVRRRRRDIFEPAPPTPQLTFDG
ncbi:MAG: HTH domain-containing protein [Actinomycetota bacterium]